MQIEALHFEIQKGKKNKKKERKQKRLKLHDWDPRGAYRYFRKSSVEGAVNYGKSLFSFAS